MTRRVGSLRWVCRALFALAMLATAVVYLLPVKQGGAASFVIVTGTSMEPSLHTGDLVIARRQPRYRVGDVVAYHVPDGVGKGRTVVHRITSTASDGTFRAKGDNRTYEDQWTPKTSDIAGILWASVPRAGWIYAYAVSPVGMALLAALAVTWFFWPVKDVGEQVADEDDRNSETNDHDVSESASPDSLGDPRAQAFIDLAAAEVAAHASTQTR